MQQLDGSVEVFPTGRLSNFELRSARTAEAVERLMAESKKVPREFTVDSTVAGRAEKIVGPAICPSAYKG